jgi:hypothetical protein
MKLGQNPSYKAENICVYNMPVGKRGLMIYMLSSQIINSHEKILNGKSYIQIQLGYIYMQYSPLHTFNGTSPETFRS